MCRDRLFYGCSYVFHLSGDDTVCVPVYKLFYGQSRPVIPRCTWYTFQCAKKKINKIR